MNQRAWIFSAGRSKRMMFWVFVCCGHRDTVAAIASPHGTLHWLAQGAFFEFNLPAVEKHRMSRYGKWRFTVAQFLPRFWCSYRRSRHVFVRCTVCYGLIYFCHTQGDPLHRAFRWLHRMFRYTAWNRTVLPVKTKCRKRNALQISPTNSPHREKNK